MEYVEYVEYVEPMQPVHPQFLLASFFRFLVGISVHQYHFIPYFLGFQSSPSVEFFLSFSRIFIADKGRNPSLYHYYGQNTDMI